MPTSAYAILGSGVTAFGFSLCCERRLEAWAGFEERSEDT